MTILYPAPAKVKSARPARKFGLGLLADAGPAKKVGYDMADREWASQVFNQDGQDFDAMADEVQAQDRLERGCCL